MRVENVGTGDLGGAAVPLFAVDGADSLIQPSTFTNAFDRCPSTPLPAEFAAGATTTGCLVYLLPDRGRADRRQLPPAPGLRADHLGRHRAAGCEEEGPPLTARPRIWAVLPAGPTLVP